MRFFFRATMSTVLATAAMVFQTHAQEDFLLRLVGCVDSAAVAGSRCVSMIDPDNTLRTIDSVSASLSRKKAKTYAPTVAYLRGVMYELKDSTGLAMGYYHDALDGYKKSKDSQRGQLRALRRMFDIHTKNGTTDSALYCMEQGLQIYRCKRNLTDEEKADYSTICNNLAILHRQNDRLAIAEQFYETAYHIRKELVEKSDRYRPLWADILNNYGLYFLDINDSDLAIYYLTKALEIRKGATDTVSVATPSANVIADNHDNLAYAYYMAKQPQLAAEHYENARSIRRGLVQSSEVKERCIDDYIATIQNLAALYKQSNRSIDALAALVELRDALSTLPYSLQPKYLEQLAATKHNIALLYGILNQRQQAVDAMNMAIKDYNLLALADREKYLPEVAVAMNQAANYYSTICDYENAEKYYKKALEINTGLYADNLVEPSEVAGNLNNLGRMYYDQSKMEDAKNCYIKARKIFDQTDPTDIKAALNKAMTNINIVMYYIYEKNSGIADEGFQDCGKYLMEAIEILRPYLFNPSANYYHEYAKKLLDSIIK